MNYQSTWKECSREAAFYLARFRLLQHLHSCRKCGGAVVSGQEPGCLEGWRSLARYYKAWRNYAPYLLGWRGCTSHVHLHPDTGRLEPGRPVPVWLPWCKLRLDLYTAWGDIPKPRIVTVHWIAEEGWWVLLCRPNPSTDTVLLWADRDGDGTPDHCEEIPSWRRWWGSYQDFCQLPAYLGMTPPAQSVQGRT